MSLLTALNTATSGMQTNSMELAVVGDNIANQNTVGFKAARAQFEDALLQQIIGAPGGGQLGLGVRLNAIQRLMTQGAMNQTGENTDLALTGPGFFILAGNHNGKSGQFYSRAGNFTVNQDGYLINLEGLRVQGYTADAQGVIQGALGDLQVGTATASANATETITIKGNLAADAVTNPGAAAFDPLNAVATSNFRTNVEIFDSMGQKYTVEVYYRKTAPGNWEYHAVTDGAGLTGGTAGQPTEIASGTLSFNTEGLLDTVVQNPSSFNPLGAINPQDITFNFGDAITGTPPGTGGLGLTQFGGTKGVSATTFVGQDGNGYGALSNVRIDNEGIVQGTFTNGTTRALGQVAVADFKAADKLDRLGGNVMVESTESGQPTIGEPASGGRGSIASGALEQSNVNLATEFVRMIAAQRGFQANSKTITTTDTLLGELMQLKR